MSSAGFHRQPAGPPASGSESSAPGSGSLDQTLRETALRQLLAEDSDEPLSAATRSALLSVIRRFRGQPLAMDPVVRELVLATLRSEFSDRWSEVALRPVSRQIAETLWEERETRRRLEAVWLHWCEEPS